MAKNSKNIQSKIRTFHRVLGLWLFIFVITAAVTGVMRANAKNWYYKDRTSSVKSKTLPHPELSAGKAMDIFEKYFPHTEINVVQLKNVLDRTVYQIESKKGDKNRLLVDAFSGEVMSPVNEALAVKIAQGYVEEGVEIIDIQQLSSFRARKNQEPRPVFDICFKDSRKTEVFIDRDTAEVLNVLDDGKRLALWVNKLHELDFGGMSRLALTISGSAIIFLSFAGLLLGLSRNKNKS